MQGWDLYYHPSHYNNYDYGGFINGKSNDKMFWQLRNGFGVSIIFQEFCVLLTLDNIIKVFGKDIKTLGILWLEICF